MGFRAMGSNTIIPIDACPVLAPELDALLPALESTLKAATDPRAISHIELAAGDNCRGILLRHIHPLSTQDQARWEAMAREFSAHLWYQPNEPQSLACAYSPDGQESLTYRLPEFALKLRFLPVDFIQVNPFINRQMISQAVDWLALSPTDAVLDLFCGLGNFTLPLASRAGQVVGVEGVESLVAKGRDNASLNGINNAIFSRADLSEDIAHQAWSQTVYDACLLESAQDRGPGGAGKAGGSVAWACAVCVL